MEYNEQVMTKEEMEEVVKAVKEAWAKIKEAFETVFNHVKAFIKQAMDYIKKTPEYKRALREQMKPHYESVSAGKSNNWRMVRGLPPIRRLPQRWRRVLQ